MMNRRRFLTISAAFAATGARAASAKRWQGVAMGAEVEITLTGPANVVDSALEDAIREVRRIEAMFSLYDSASYLSQLNNGKRMRVIRPARRLFQVVTQVHQMTEGLFDPTIQTMWDRAAGQSENPNGDVDWNAVQTDQNWVQLGAGQKITLNGIAQGFATDRVRHVLAGHGMKRALVNIGEFGALGGPWRLGVSDPEHGVVGTLSLTDGAIATSSPGALVLGDAQSHIFHPFGGAPRWSTVAVEAANAALADGLSTGLCLADIQVARKIVRHPDVRRIVLVDSQGDVTTI